MATSAFKEVLAVFKERRRRVKYQPSTNKLEENRNLMDAIQEAFSDLTEGSSGSIYLQTETKDWGLVDVCGDCILEDHGTVYVKQDSRNEVYTSKHLSKLLIYL